MRSRIATALVLAIALLSSGKLWGYALLGPKWSTATITMHLQLGAPSGPLLDGSTAWGAVAETAMNQWNSSIAGTRFAAVRDSTVARADGNGVNNVFFSPTLYGDAFGSGVLAVTLYYTSGSRTTEADVVFNQGFNWNSYRGAQRSQLYDFQRVALHEFGHVLGLGHPDEIGQSVSALMNSRVGNLDGLTSDDINGGRALYGTPSGVVAAPIITQQPVNQTVTPGQTASFTVVASGTGLTYQWAKAGVAIAGASAATFTRTNVALADAGTYAVTVTNAGGSVTSSNVLLTVNNPTPPPAPVPVVLPPTLVAPSIATPPASQSVARGTNVTLSVVAVGSAPFTYQWFKSGNAISGATLATLTLNTVQDTDAGTYFVRVTNSAGFVTSASATLTVQIPPAIATQPVDQTVNAGASLTLGVVATGTPAPAFQWRKNGSAISGATSANFQLAAARAEDAGSYSVVVSNVAGSITSSAANVMVRTAPAFTLQPVGQTVTAGTAVTFTSAASGSPAPTFQWRKNGVDLPGATSATFTIATTQAADAGNYTIVATNAAGSVTSATVALVVNSSRLINLSTRGFVAAGGALTPGFVIRGADPKPVVIRAIGPGLAGFGVTDALRDPQLAVIAAGEERALVSNDTWGGTSELRDAFVGVGAFPLAADSQDAAARTTLAPSSYSVRITPAEGTSGIALAELYDAGSNSTARLVNASTLGFVGTGEKALTPGFVIAGNAPKRLLIRAVGPGLAQFGVSDLLSDPLLQVIPAGSATVVASSDNWAGTAELKAAFTQAGAFALGDTSKDAAVVITLSPGAYSVVVAGFGGETGTALVEIYDLDP